MTDNRGVGQDQVATEPGVRSFVVKIPQSWFGSDGEKRSTAVVCTEMT
jgi:hypothetical protein